MMVMDKFNSEILRVLSVEGRIANTELADRVGLSASACLRRVQELERQGVIKGYRAVLDHSQLGGGFVAYVSVGLGEHSTRSQHGFEKAISTSPEVRECHNVTGNFEYLLRVETADIEAFKRFHADVLGAIEQVRTITTHVVMGSPKDERA